MMTQFEQAAIAFHARVEAGAYDAAPEMARVVDEAVADDAVDQRFCKVDGREG